MDQLSRILDSPNKLIIFSLDREYRYLYFNKNHEQTMKKIWGVEIKPGKSMLDYIKSKNDRIKAKKNFDKALNGEDFSLVEEYGDKKLNRLFYEDIYTPLYGEKGDIQGLTVFVNDITSRQLKEVEVHETEERFRAIIEGTFEGIILMRIEDMKILYMNPSALSLFGYKKLPSNKNARDLHPDFEQDKIKSRLFSKPLTKTETLNSVSCITKKGKIFHANVSAIDIRISDEKYLVAYYTDITREKESEDKIKFQQNILEAVGQSVIVTDINGIIKYWNRKAESMYGWKREEVLGRSKEEFLPTNMTKKEHQEVIEYLSKGNHWTSEFQIKNKSGRELPILITSSPIFDDNSELTGMISISVDISDRIKSEKHIRDNEKLYKSIISSLSEGLVVQDKTDRIIVANESAAKILGLTMGQLLGRDSYDPRWKALKKDGTPFKPDEHPSMVTLKTGKSLDNQLMNVFVGTSHRKTISINTRPIKDDNGEISGSVASFTDITERERAQNILRESESRLKNISDSVPGAVLRYRLIDEDHDEILFLSQGAEVLWEVKKEEVLKDANVIWSKVYEEDLAGLKQSILNSAETMKAWNHEWRIFFPDGRIKWLNGRGLPSKSKDGSVIWDSIILDITEQKDTLNRLNESQKLIESINQNINEGIYRADHDSLIYVNKAFLRMFGYDSFDELKKEKVGSIYKNPEERKKLIKNLEKNGYFENQEIVFRRKDNSEFIGLISSRKYENSNGKSYWDGAIRDVTAERLAFKRIQQNQQLLESINRNINEAIYRSVKGEGLIYINDEFVKMFGYGSTEEMLEEKPENLYKNPADRKTLAKELEKNGSYLNREVEFRRKDGTYFWGSISSIMLKNDEGQVYIDGAIRDISTQKEADLALRRQAETQKLLRNISSNFINLPLDKVNEAINRSLEALGKFADADRAYVFDVFLDSNYCVNTFEWVNEGISSEIDNLQFVPLDEIPETIDPYKRGENVNIPDVDALNDSFFRKVLKEQKIKSLIGVPIMDNGSCIGFVGFDAVRSKKKFSREEISMLQIFSDMMLNIRNRAQNQIEVRQLLNTTTDQNKRLKEFSFMTSHNIRSSVSNMLGLTRLILEDPGNKAYLELLNKAAEKLDTTIKNINQLLHFESSFQTRELLDCNVWEVINRILELNQKIIREKQIELQIEIPDGFTIRAIPAFIDSIFFNLLSNAFKYGITRNSKTIRIWLEEKRNEDIVYIRDKGWGIDLEKYGDKLFKLGSRLHMTSEGQGLGLYMTKHQIEELGGSIEIESEVDLGTTFILHFPKTKQNSYSRVTPT